MTPKPPKRGKAKAASQAAQKQSPFPTRDEVLRFIADNPGPVGKREIARAFRLSAAQRVELKIFLRELKSAGAVAPIRRRLQSTTALPPVSLMIVGPADEDGMISLTPAEWHSDLAPPTIQLKPLASDRDPPGEGSKILARLALQEDGIYVATLMKQMDDAAARIVGVFHNTRAGGRVEPADRKAKGEVAIEQDHTLQAEDGDLVLVELSHAPRLGLQRGRVKQVIGRADDPRAVSLLVIAAKDIPTEFPPEAIADAEGATIPELGRRTDLRAVPLVTIDGEDARDFDDAVFAEPDPDPANAGGWRLIVAIADVAHYVRAGSPLDREAFRRGNSVYFPDRVVPMLPEALSNGLCSLKPHEPRACMAFEMFIAEDGRLLRHTLMRGLMRSVARLTYNQVQSARNGAPDDVTGPLADSIIAPLYGAYASLSRARARRGTLELDLPERKVSIGEDGRISGITERERLDSHKLIEEFMILANVAAAELAGRATAPTLYRVHDRPSATKLDTVREVIRDLGFNLSKGQVIKPTHLTQLLEQAAGTLHAPLINEVVLRAQATAIYSPDNIGHFGLSLRNYAHFTSPIRRYSDLIVHRTLIRLAGLGDDGLSLEDGKRLDMVGEHISWTERRAAEAERDAVGRYVAAFMADHVGEIFQGRISGVNRFGLFVKVDGTGAEGLVPIRSLPDDYYVHEEQKHRLVGRRSGRTYQLAQRVTVKLREADGITGSTLFGLMGEDELQKAVSSPPRGGRPKPGGPRHR